MTPCPEINVAGVGQLLKVRASTMLDSYDRLVLLVYLASEHLSASAVHAGIDRIGGSSHQNERVKETHSSAPLTCNGNEVPRDRDGTGHEIGR